MMDRKLILGLALVSVVAMLTMSSAGQLECTFRDSCQSGEITVMGYYPDTNLAGLRNRGSWKLCCSAPFGLSHLCSGDINQYTAMVRLSSSSNALAELESMTPAYPRNRRICLKSPEENIAVMYKAVHRDWDEELLCPEGYKCMLSLSDITEANVAPCMGDQQYPVKVCATEYTSDVCVPLIIGKRILGWVGSYRMLIYKACCGVSDYICPESFEVNNIPIVCPSPGDPDCFEVCNDGVDNDHDGRPDCQDDDCCGSPACWRYYQDNGLQESAFDKLCCNDGWDNDGDGLIDSEDPSCASEIPEVNCNNSLDDDWDGLTDCDDPDCCNDTGCLADYFGSNESAAGPNGIPGICCANGLDEDNDGYVDWDDPNCYYEGPDTPKNPGTCDDGIDNDGDGLIDCDDPDCCLAYQCPYSNDESSEGLNDFLCCDNGWDEDNDGLVDMSDPDCAGAERYNGTIHDMVKSGEAQVFDIYFTDRSIAPPPTVSWDFSLNPGVDYTGNCLMTNRISMQDVSIPLRERHYHVEELQLALRTTQNNYCMATVHATAPDGTEINGTYLLEHRYLPPIDPHAQIPEIPAVIHPINIYSPSPADAQDAYDRAEGVVAALLADCGGSECGGNVAASTKLNDAWRHFKAAERYLEECLAGQGQLCRLSQYYSDRANQLAIEGQSLI